MVQRVNTWGERAARPRKCMYVVGLLIGLGYSCSSDKANPPVYPDAGPKKDVSYDVPQPDTAIKDPDTLVPCELFTDIIDVATYTDDIAPAVALAGGHDKIWAFYYHSQSGFTGFRLGNYTSTGSFTSDDELVTDQEIESTLVSASSPSVALGPEDDKLIAYTAQSGGVNAFHLLRANGDWPPMPGEGPGQNPVAFSPGTNVVKTQVTPLPEATISETYTASDVVYGAAWYATSGTTLYYDVVKRGIHQAATAQTVSDNATGIFSLSQKGLEPVLAYTEQNDTKVDLRLRRIDPETGALGTEQTVWAERTIEDVAAIRILSDSTVVAWTQVITSRREVHAMTVYDNGSFGTEYIIAVGIDPSNAVALAPLGQFAVLAYRGGPITDKEVRVTMLKGDAAFAFDGTEYEYFVVDELGDVTDVELGPPSLAVSGDDTTVALGWAESDGTGRTRLALLSCTY